MLLHPDSITPANTNHTFRADGTICKNCHGADVGLEGLEGQFTVASNAVVANLLPAFQAAIGGGTTPTPYWMYVGSPAAWTAFTTWPTRIVPAGRSGFTFTFGATSYTVGFNQVRPTAIAPQGVLNVSFNAAPTTASPGTDFPIKDNGVFAKTNWNWNVVGNVNTADPVANIVHNPTFVFTILANTNQKLDACTLYGPTICGEVTW
jgi:hypothetical protein